MLLFSKMKFKTGDKVRIIKIYYPISTDKLGKTSLIEVNEDSIYLTELKLYINQYCNEIDDLKNYEINEHIYVPNVISTKTINLK
jgi:hypothetical protein